MSAGQLFCDINRLSLFPNQPNQIKLLIYLTDFELAKYFNKSINGHYEFFNLPVGSPLTINDNYIKGQSQTFMKHLASDSINADVLCLWSESLPNEHELRIYEVQ